MNEKEKEITLMAKGRAIEKKREELEGHKHLISVKEKTIALLEEEIKLRSVISDSQIKNFEFSDDWKPAEVWMTTDEYKNLAKDLQRVINDQNLLVKENMLYEQKSHLGKILNDLNTLETQLNLDVAEYDEIKNKEAD
jgi:hypothetical protein